MPKSHHSALHKQNLGLRSYFFLGIIAVLLAAPVCRADVFTVGSGEP